ncbi:hypothetical protein CONCODRAFT_12574 [Conidiobolus coronatus NRRL 28638]|uniref:Uncharacterized protein n=1 Tax=Conidiobolus coronatus (strain ATCC 28846 / CBS 209.66 / NRRL 28638) TaxID=796925 RepID=A0A137NSP1_CONC2|nr:hypothetical protein CONCODRAFT_12574 [Conidiobolus coronatus NRRL 28638]|eukprot:KXN65754.1 hypothetical protein CONCODRAFT_12574 [Conidiobolus coronatus NRRL 28638]
MNLKLSLEEWIIRRSQYVLLTPCERTKHRSHLKSLGGPIFNDGDTIKKLGIKLVAAIKKTGQGTNLEPGDLTPRRLQRFFRHCIKEYLVDNRETMIPNSELFVSLVVKRENEAKTFLHCHIIRGEIVK